MQVFVPYASPMRTARCLDPKRLRKQILECRDIYRSATGGTEGWKNHPVTKMWKGNLHYLVHYHNCLQCFQDGKLFRALIESVLAGRPKFLKRGLLLAHRRRLYTKNPDYYKQFAKYGRSEVNWYWSPEKKGYIYYVKVKGKRLPDTFPLLTHKNPH